MDTRVTIYVTFDVRVARDALSVKALALAQPVAGATAAHPTVADLTVAADLHSCCKLQWDQSVEVSTCSTSGS